MSQYGELHAHSMWSLLDGVGSAEAGARRAAELGHPFKAMTEHAVLSGVVHHMDACREVGIQPIVGVEAYYRPNRLDHNKETNWEYFHMLLLAKDVRGWRSLKLLTSEAFRTGFYRKPCIDDELLNRWHEGLMISTSCVSGYIPRAILRGDNDAVKRHCDQLTRWVGDDWYFEIQPHAFEDLQIVNREAVSLAQSLGRPVVAKRDAHAPDDTWVETQHVSVMMRLGGSMVTEAHKEHEADEKYDLRIADTAYIASENQTREDFRRHHPGLAPRVVDEAIANTGWVASRCVPWLMDRTPKMPRYLDSHEEDYEELRRRVFAGLERLGHADKPAYVRAVEKELRLYRDKRFSAFFLWVDEMIRWLRSPDGLPPCEWDPHPASTKMPEKVGLGRGSAGGCRVAYALGIILINPENYDLSFERFLNPDRGGMPDIDVDLTSRGAELAKEWFKRRKGPDKVYDMIAHSTFGAREALRRVGMVYAPIEKDALREWHARMNALTKNIPDDETDLDLESLRAHIPALAEFAENQPKVFAHAARLQKGNSKITEHASAIVISDVPLDEIVPVMKKSAKDDYLVTAFGNSAEKETISDLGLLKLDLLVVVALARQAYAEQLIARVHDVELDLDQLPALEHPEAADPGAMRIFCLGAKNGIFQWDGFSNMASLTKRIKPTTIHHLAAANAGVRPGVSQHAESYVARRHGEPFEYWDPAVEPALRETFGLPLYQEQIMAIFQILGGYTAAEADTVRRIMGKYYRIKGGVAAEMLATHRSRFVENATLACHGGRDVAEMIWNFCGSASEYLFNKSHADAYSLIAHGDAYLKAHHPDAFYASLLTFPPAWIKKKAPNGQPSNYWRNIFYERTVREARNFDVDVLPPDVNESDDSFTIVGNAVRFGLTGIKGLGPAMVADVLNNRPFASIEDMGARLTACNKAGRQALGAAGALDRFGTRENLTLDERATFEEERIGVALSGEDKLAPVREGLRALINTADEVESAPNGQRLVVGGEIVSGRETKTKIGAGLKLTIAFGADEYLVSIPPWDYDETKPKGVALRELIASDAPVVVRGYRDVEYDCVACDEIKAASEVLEIMNPERETVAA
jgi:DNA polymerase-3 subunit alpha